MTKSTKNQAVKLSNVVVLDSKTLTAIANGEKVFDNRTNNPGRPVNKQSARYKRLAKQAKYALALSKEMLGSIRGKYQTIPIPGSETTLDYTRLLSEAASEKQYLLDTLREDLEKTSRQSQEERKQAETDAGKAAKANEPVFIYVG